jgi:hypothetical protein
MLVIVEEPGAKKSDHLRDYSEGLGSVRYVAGDLLIRSKLQLNQNTNLQYRNDRELPILHYLSQ